jgi:hypothetical protein
MANVIMDSRRKTSFLEVKKVIFEKKNSSRKKFLKKIIKIKDYLTQE